MIKSLTLSIGLALTLVTPAFGTIEWGFDANDNPVIAAGGPASIVSFAQITESPGQGRRQQWNAAASLNPDDIVKITAPTAGAIIDRMVLTVVPEPGVVIAGTLLLVPFALSTIRVLRRDRASKPLGYGPCESGSAIA